MSSSTKSAGYWVLGAALIIFGCTQKRSVDQRVFYNIDSLVNSQIHLLKGQYELNKSVAINEKQEQLQLVPDSTQWSRELEIFRQLEQVNKVAFRDSYVVSETRDTNSNLTVREIKAKEEVPVSVLRLYYLRTPNDLRKVEATFVEENALYTTTKRVVMELERFNNVNLLHRYRIESSQVSMIDDSVHFVIAGEVSM